MGTRVIRVIVLVVTIVLFGVGIFLVYEILAPEIEYRIDTPDERDIIQIIQSETKRDQNRLYIPSIGVDMEIGGDKGFLDYGGWVQEVGYDAMPELIAVHRFGFNSLTAEEKVKQTLYHVYKLEKGDRVFIIWDDEKYEYKVNDVVDGTNNPDGEYLILYTCKFYSSKKRIFVILDN